MEEKVDLDSILLSPSGLISNKGRNEPNNDIKDEQSSLNPLQDSSEKSTFINKVHKPVQNNESYFGRKSSTTVIYRRASLFGLSVLSCA